MPSPVPCVSAVAVLEELDEERAKKEGYASAKAREEGLRAKAEAEREAREKEAKEAREAKAREEQKAAEDEERLRVAARGNEIRWGLAENEVHFKSAELEVKGLLDAGVSVNAKRPEKVSRAFSRREADRFLDSDSRKTWVKDREEWTKAAIEDSEGVGMIPLVGW